MQGTVDTDHVLVNIIFLVADIIQEVKSTQTYNCGRE